MFELSEAAAADIEAIFERSLIDFGLVQTELYVASLEQCLTLLGENPKMGSSAEDIRTGYRRFSHKSHVVFYREAERGILVVRVLHSRMDVESAFSK